MTDDAKPECCRFLMELLLISEVQDGSSVATNFEEGVDHPRNLSAGE